MTTTIDGSASVTINSGAILGITSGTAVTLTTQTSVDFTSIPSWVKRITVMSNGVSTSGTSAILIQLGTSSGVISTGYVATSIRVNNVNTTSGLSSTSGFVISVSGGTDAYSGSMTIMNVSGNIWVSNHTCKHSTGACTFGGGDISIAAVLDRIRITTVNGTDTFDAGSINIMYEG